MLLAPSSQQTQVPNGQGCAWNVLEHGSVVHIRLIILEDLAPIIPAAYPPREAPESPTAQVNQAEQPESAPKDFFGIDS